MPGLRELGELQEEIANCVKCPRLVEYRQRVAQTKRRMYKDWDYWGSPLPSFGDLNARVLILGLAPAAHGGNRTGRMFTGDRSGDLLFETLYKFGFSNSPNSIHRNDGLILRDVYITASLRCAPPGNKPLPGELANCKHYLLRELELLRNIRIVLALGKIAFDTYLASRQKGSVVVPSPRPRFAHGAVYTMAEGRRLISSYHPSQQNTQTGRLTSAMFQDIFAKVREFLDQFQEPQTQSVHT